MKQVDRLKATSHGIPLRLTDPLMANVNLSTCSKNTITDNHGNPAPTYLKQFQVSRKPVETDKIHLDTANRACVKTAVGHKPYCGRNRNLREAALSKDKNSIGWNEN